MIKAEHVPYDTTYMFPDEDDNLTDYTGRSAQVMIPNGLLQSIGKYNAIYNYVATWKIALSVRQLLLNFHRCP